MKINLVLAPEQAPATLLNMQAEHKENIFYLGKESQLSGTNVLIIDSPEIVEQFQRPMSFEVLEAHQPLKGNVVHQIVFQTKEHNDELIAQLLPNNAVLAQTQMGKTEYMIWTFYDNHSALAEFLNSDIYEQMKHLMKNPYTTSYSRITSEEQLSLTHQMKDFDDKSW